MHSLLAVWLLACGGGGETGLGASLSPFVGKASCEAMVDALFSNCPDLAGGRLGAIEDCERDRQKYEPIGCGAELAQHVLCLSQDGVDCNDDWLGCMSRRAELQRCETNFLLTTGCDRNASSDNLMCVPGVTSYSIESEGLPYSFQCVGALPDNCERNPDSTTLSCCSAFVDDPSAYFEPFEPGPGDVPPDYGDVDFTDPAACRGFAEEQQWGSCEASVGCTCDACAAEVAACAAVYSCLFVRQCSLGINDCSPGDDPYFTGYGPAASLEDDLVACMQAAGCDPRCD